MTCTNTEFACQQVAVVDNAALQRAVGLTYAGTAVRHRAGCQGMALQKGQCGQTGLVFADARIIEDT